GGRTTALAQPGFSARRRGDARRLLPAAEHLFVLADERRQGDVPELPRLLGLARADGGVAACAAAPPPNRGSASRRAGAQMGRLAPAEILISCENTGTRRLPVKGCSFKVCIFSNRKKRCLTPSSAGAHRRPLPPAAIAGTQRSWEWPPSPSGRRSSRCLPSP